VVLDHALMPPARWPMVPASFGEGKGPLARKRCLDATPPGVDREGRVRARVGLRPHRHRGDLAPREGVPPGRR